jgi:hypothetical protein
LTAIINEFLAKIRGVRVTWPDAANLSTLDVSAAANTSAGAPACTCDTNAEEDPKLNVTRTLEFALRKSRANALNTSVNEDAADTVIEPVRLVVLA